jgi:hypothetical protein
METLLATDIDYWREACYHGKNREIDLHKGQRKQNIMSNLGINIFYPVVKRRE